MADSSDVALALCEMIEAIVYPDGAGRASVVTTPVRIYPGWPDPGTLAKDLAPVAGYATALHVSVFPNPSERNTTRFQPVEQTVTANAVTYMLSGAGQAVSVGGAAPATYFAQNLAVFVDGKPYIVTSAAGQSPAQIAAALQALIVVDHAETTVSGAVITLPAGARLGPLRVGTSQTTAKEVRRTEKLFQIIVWTDTPAKRAALASVIDPVLSDTPFFTLPDGFAARLRYKSTADIDSDQKQGIYRRDLFYTVEYATTRASTATEIIAEQLNLDDSAGAVIETSYI